MRSMALWFNTLTAGAAAAGLSLAAVGVLLVMSGALEPQELQPFSWFAGPLTQAQALEGGNEALAFVLAVVAVLAGFVVTLIELRLLLPAQAAVLLIDEDEMGRTTIERTSVESFLALVVLPIAGIESASVRARSNRQGELGVKARLSLSPSRDTVVPTAAQAARKTMIEAASEQLGLEIAEIETTTAMQPTRADRKRKRLQLA